jgi:hypothetical protein
MGDNYDGDGGTKVIKYLGLEMKKETNKKLKAKYIWLGAFWFILKTP